MTSDGICAPGPGKASVEAPPSDGSSEPFTAISDQPSLETMPSRHLHPTAPSKTTSHIRSERRELVVGVSKRADREADVPMPRRAHRCRQQVRSC